MSVSTRNSTYVTEGGRRTTRLTRSPNYLTTRSPSSYKTGLSQSHQSLSPHVVADEPVADEGVHPSVINAAKPRQPHLSTPTEMATEMETVPTVLAVRVEVRACV